MINNIPLFKMFKKKNNDLSYIEYNKEFVDKLCQLEKDSHNQDEPEKLAMNALRVAAEFYDADWCGVVEPDLIFHIWNPIWWTSGKNHKDVVSKFFEQEKISLSQEWIEALHNAEAVIIEDIEIYKERDFEEYMIYQNLNIQSVIAYPFWSNPSGFIIALNPKRHCDKFSFLQILAYVMHCTIAESKCLENQSLSIQELKNEKEIVINLFGTFEIRTLKKVFKEEEINSPKIIRVLTYLLLHPDQNYPARKLCDAIWPDEVIDNPSSKIKSLIYRLHKTFDDVLEDKLVICTSKGYKLNPELNFITDFQLFESYRLLSQKTLSAKAKIETLKKTIDIYKGNLLASALGEHWILSIERDFHYKYIGIINELLQTFYESENYYDIQKYASKALTIENSNKELYFWLIASMYKLGATAMARGELKNAEKSLLKEEY